MVNKTRGRSKAKTKATILREIRAKAEGANPLVKRVFLRGLGNSTKTELERVASRMRVTGGGDISLI